jgi:hypothetical protein
LIGDYLGEKIEGFWSPYLIEIINELKTERKKQHDNLSNEQILHLNGNNSDQQCRSYTYVTALR